MREKEFLRVVGYLGSRWARDKPRIKAYACNRYFIETAVTMIFLRFVKSQKYKNHLQLAREIYQELGESGWIGNSDPITQLAIKTGVIREVEY